MFVNTGAGTKADPGSIMADVVIVLPTAPAHIPTFSTVRVVDVAPEVITPAIEFVPSLMFTWRRFTGQVLPLPIVIATVEPTAGITKDALTLEPGHWISADTRMPELDTATQVAFVSPVS